MRLSHVAWNFAGLAAPLVVAIFTIPFLIANIGPERFGLLALAWGLIGYAGAFDLGIGRAATQIVSRHIGDNELAPIAVVLSTAGRVTLISGLAGGVIIGGLAFSGAYDSIVTSQTSSNEVMNSALLLAVALPAQAMSATYRGINEAFLNFKGVNILRGLLGVINFGGPFVVSLWTNNLAFLVGSLALSRLAALFVFKLMAERCLENASIVFATESYSSKVARDLFRFGGWVSVSSILSPIMLQADRFFIAFSISAAAVSTYVLPYEIVIQSLILVGAVSSVLFPSLSQMMARSPNQWRQYFLKHFRRVAIMMSLICCSLALALPVFLPLWLGAEFIEGSVRIGQILCLGVFANSLSTMFYACIHAKGRADLTAKIHMVELPLYLIGLTYALKIHGIEGAAWAYVARMTLDAMLMGLVWRRL